MHKDSVKTMENLSLFAHIGGVFSVFVGLVVVFIDIMNNDFTHIQVGFYIFISGYAFVKISQRISQVLVNERFWLTNNNTNESPPNTPS